MIIRRSIAAATLVVTGLAVHPAPSHGATMRVVHPGQSIQRAVDQAHAGDTVLVLGGVYHQTVSVTTDGIRLLGRGAILRPPAHAPTGSPCIDPSSGTLDGICLIGRFDASGTVVDPIADVTVAGFTVEGFSNTGIFMIGGKDVVVRDNVARDNTEYGIARFVSVGGRVEANDVSGAGEAGLYWGDSPESGAIVQNNRVHGNGNFGIFLRDSSHGVARDNVIEGNCVGIMLLRTGAAAVTDWTLQHNVAHDNNRACPASDDAPPLSGIGIAVAGADHATVTGNAVSSNRPTGPSLVSGGVVVISTSSFGGADATHVDVHRNVIRGDSPADLVWDGSGSGIRLGGNSCGSSLPAGLC